MKKKPFAMWHTRKLNSRRAMGTIFHTDLPQRKEVQDLQEPESDEELAALLDEGEPGEEGEGAVVQNDRNQKEDPKGSRPSPKTPEEPEEHQKVYKMVNMSICLPLASKSASEVWAVEEAWLPATQLQGYTLMQVESLTMGLSRSGAYREESLGHSAHQMSTRAMEGQRR